MGMCQCSPVVQTGIGLFQLSICLLFTVIGYASPYWVDYNNVNFGLWKYCAGDVCASLTDNLETSKIKAARAFGILGMLTGVGSIVCAVLFLLRRRSTFLLAASITAMVTFVLVMIEFIAAVEEIKDISTHYGYYFGLTLTAFIQAFFGALSFLGARHTDSQQCQRA